MNTIGKILMVPLLALVAGALVLPALAQGDRGRWASATDRAA